MLFVIDFNRLGPCDSYEKLCTFCAPGNKWKFSWLGPSGGSQTRILVDSKTRTYPLNLLCGSLMNHHLLSVESFILLIYLNGFSLLALLLMHDQLSASSRNPGGSQNWKQEILIRMYLRTSGAWGWEFLTLISHYPAATLVLMSGEKIVYFLAPIHAFHLHKTHQISADQS